MQTTAKSGVSLLAVQRFSKSNTQFYDVDDEREETEISSTLQKRFLADLQFSTGTSFTSIKILPY